MRKFHVDTRRRHCARCARARIASIAARSGAASRQPAADELLFTCSGDFAPAITDATAGCAASPETAKSRHGFPPGSPELANRLYQRRILTRKPFRPKSIPRAAAFG